MIVEMSAVCASPGLLGLDIMHAEVSKEYYKSACLTFADWEL